MRNRVKFIFPASVAACVFFAVSALGQGQVPATPPTPTTQTQNVPTRTLPNVPEDTFNGWSFGAMYWLTNGNSDLLPGQQSADPTAQHLALGQINHRAIGARLVTPAGKYNRLVISGFEAKGSGSSTAKIDQTYFGQTFPLGDVLQDNYRVRNVKVSWNYLMYPAPPTSAFRIKALFEVQYVGARASVSAPLDPDALNAVGSRTIFLPTIGLGFDIVPSKNFHFEFAGSGFGLPQKSLILDGEASAVVRVSHIELAFGGKYFRYRTSPKKDEFIQGNLYGPYVGIRWVFGK
jgi:hypothetical protein